MSFLDTLFLGYENILEIHIAKKFLSCKNTPSFSFKSYKITINSVYSGRGDKMPTTAPLSVFLL